MFFSIPHLTLLNQCQQYCNWSNFMSFTPTIFQRFFHMYFLKWKCGQASFWDFFLMSKNTQYQAFTLMINFSTQIHRWEKNPQNIYSWSPFFPFLLLLLSVATVVFMRALESSTLTNGRGLAPQNHFWKASQVMSLWQNLNYMSKKVASFSYPDINDRYTRRSGQTQIHLMWYFYKLGKF